MELMASAAELTAQTPPERGKNYFPKTPGNEVKMEDPLTESVIQWFLRLLVSLYAQQIFKTCLTCLTIYFQCPWPFSEYSKEEVTIDQEKNKKEDNKVDTTHMPVELATSAASTATINAATKTTPAAINDQENKKKRKKDKVDASTVRVSPEGKKIKVKEKVSWFFLMYAL